MLKMDRHVTKSDRRKRVEEVMNQVSCECFVFLMDFVIDARRNKRKIIDLCNNRTNCSCVWAGHRKLIAAFHNLSFFKQ